MSLVGSYSPPSLVSVLFLVEGEMSLEGSYSPPSLMSVSQNLSLEVHTPQWSYCKLQCMVGPETRLRTIVFLCVMQNGFLFT